MIDTKNADLLAQIKTTQASARSVAAIWNAPQFIVDWLEPSCFIGHTTVSIAEALEKLYPVCPVDLTLTQIKRYHAEIHAYLATFNVVSACEAYNAFQTSKKPRRIKHHQRIITTSVQSASDNARSAVTNLMESLKS